MQEKLILQLPFNPGLALTGFRTTLPWCLALSKTPAKGYKQINFMACSLACCLEKQLNNKTYMLQVKMKFRLK